MPKLQYCRPDPDFSGSYEQYSIGVLGNSWDLTAPYDEATRGVTDRKLSVDGAGDDALEWTYSKGVAGATDVYQTVAPDTTCTQVYKTHLSAPMHYSPNYLQFWDFGLVDPTNGTTVETRAYGASSTACGGSLLRRELTSYERTVHDVETLPNTWHIYAYRNPRPVKKTTVLFEGTGSALAQTTTFSYDTDSTADYSVGHDQTQVYSYNYAVISNTSSSDTAQAGTISTISSGSLAKYSETTYLTSSTYRNVNILGLPTQVNIRDGSGNIVSQSQMAYDESGYVPSGTTHGLPTSSKVWDSTKGVVTNSSAFLTTHATFDTYGNRTVATDAKGSATTTTYDSTYHTFPITVTSPVPDDSDVNGSSSAFTTSATYDATTGLVLTTTDANSQTTSMEYNDYLLRPTKITAPNGQQTTTEYGAGISDSNRWVKVRSQIDGTNWSEAKSFYDGVGRTYKTQKTDSADSQGDIFTITNYDTMGRVKETSNPFRNVSSPSCATNIDCTKPEYDDLSRTKKVTSPDTNDVQITYGLSTSGVIGTTKTITDQAGKKRTGITDASGNMTRVIEDPDATSPNSPLTTDYVFDTLGHLRETTQGSQNRYFMYDSLGRVLYGRQVEQTANSNFSGSTYADPITSNNQWSVKYTYDDNSNIAATTDALNKTITASYDRLNRLILRDYSDSAMPDVSFYYDGKGLGSVPSYSNGKTTKVTSSVSENRNTSFDTMGHTLTSQQITDGTTYGFTYTYNLAGGLVDETYPSGRVVENTLDSDGDLSQVQSKKNSTSGFFTYAGSFSYNAAGAATKMQLGNGRWETASYNDREQVTMIGLGTTGTTQDLLKLDFTYGTSDNNGSMQTQTITVPTVGANTGFVATQTYSYDTLNRIHDATENLTPTGGSASQSWKQTFVYDRYGNRTFDTSGSNTTTLGSCSTAVCNPTISTSTNRLTSSGYSYDAEGSVTQDASGQRFGCDQENRQNAFFTSSNSGSTPDATYSFDGEGKRIEKNSGSDTTIFVYDAGGQMAAEYSTTLASTQQVSYLTEDHLGSPRITTNETGAVTSRKDFAAFGDETVTSQRTTGLGYNPPSVRQDYTGYQKDDESGLEYSQARYYNSQHGRFTSVDPLTASATIRNPQTLNRYSYALNSPYKFTDPLGLMTAPLQDGGCSAENSSCDDGGSFGSADESAWPSSIVTSAESASGNGSATAGEPLADESDPPPPPCTTCIKVEPGKNKLYAGEGIDQPDGKPLMTGTGKLDGNGNEIATQEKSGFGVAAVNTITVVEGGNTIEDEEMTLLETIEAGKADPPAAGAAVVKKQDQPVHQYPDGNFYDVQGVFFATKADYDKAEAFTVEQKQTLTLRGPDGKILDQKKFSIIMTKTSVVTTEIK